VFWNLFTQTTERPSAAAPESAPSANGANVKAALVDLVPMPIVAMDKDFKVLYLNEAAASVVGRPADECVGARCYELFKTPHCRTADCRCAQAMESGEPRTGETIASPRGTAIPIRYTGAPLKGPDGRTIGAVEYVVDMTDEAQITTGVLDLVASALAGELETRADAAAFDGNFRGIVSGVNRLMDAMTNYLDVMPAPAILLDKDLTMRFVNEAAAQVMGLSRDQATGRKCFEVLKAGDCGTDRCAVAAALRTGETHTSETEIHPGDKRFSISYSGVPLRNASGEIVGAMEIATDLTGLKRAMGDAAEKVEYLNSVPTPIVVVDREFTVRFMNPAGAQALGRTQDACMGQKCFDLFNTGDCRNSGCAVAKAMQTDTVVTSDTVAQLPSGPVPIRYTGRALKDESGQIIGALEYVLDISKEVEITAELSELAKAAIEGKLDTRADAEKFEGNYKTIVSGVNEAIEALIEPIKEAASVMEQVASRALDVRVTGDYQGDHAAIKDNLNQAIENLDLSLTQVAEATEQVTSASNQISAGSQSLAEGANEQASSLEEVSSSLEEMASMTRQNADNADEAKGLAQSARGSAEKGNDVMERMSGAIDKIKASSDETAKIIKTIDEIAFQTNLLALNAAVEAARAGEAGKGFAVVAEEVRNLAQRSAEAAKVTAAMIEDSQKNADGGVKTTEEVGTILAEIMGGAAKVSEIIAEIAAASQEQAKGIDQVNTAVAQMSKVTQQNAANSEESASAAEELNSQAEELMNMIGTFKLSAGNGNGHAKGHSVRSGVAAPTFAPGSVAGFEGAFAPVQGTPASLQHAVQGSAPDGDGNGHGKAPAKVRAGSKKRVRPKPQEVIPLDEDEELDF
jgi:methyl-accepting chemotaxis protein